MPYVNNNPTQVQSFDYNHQNMNIVRPYIGSKLYRVNKKTLDGFVVTKVFTKQKGKNKGVVDKIYLCKITSDCDNNIEYDPQKKIILQLNNHGRWWNAKLQREYVFYWDTLK